MSRSLGTLLLAATAALVVALDQLSKWLVLRELPAGVAWPGPDALVGRFFSFTHVRNTGVAFGMFQGKSDLLGALAVVVVAVLLVYRARVGKDDPVLDVAIGLQVGGALGNLIDRVRIGHVTDFLDFKVWPVFNVADTSIFCGVVLLAWWMWREEKRERQVAATATDG